MGMTAAARSYFELPDDGYARQMFALRFRSKVVDGPGGCRLWSGWCNGDGYGVATIRKPRLILAHRAAWELTHGPIPDGLSVLHHCDNPPCVNADDTERHLFLGTNADNMRDMFAKNRRPTVSLRGSAHPGAKLTEEQVIAIRGMRHVHYRDVMSQFGIGRSTLYRIWDDESPHWGHVKHPPTREFRPEQPAPHETS
jgi:hypothetical protein